MKYLILMLVCILFFISTVLIVFQAMKEHYYLHAVLNAIFSMIFVIGSILYFYKWRKK